MLKITLPEEELFNSDTNTIYTVPKVELKLEHSLVSVSKWESKWHKPFLSDREDKTQDEIIDYIRCMIVGSDSVDKLTLQRLSNNREAVNKIFEYIKDPMTATTISKNASNKKREIITAEIIYYDMIALQIPIELEKWHLNKLLTLIQVCSIKNSPDKGSKMSMNQIYSEQARIKAANRAKYKTPR